MVENLGESILTLSTDNRGLNKGLKSGEVKTKSTMQRMAASTKIFTGALATLAGPLGLLGVVAGIGKVTAAFGEQQLAEIKFNTALKQTGEFTEETVQEFTKFAQELQKVAKVGDEVTLSMGALLLNLGVTPDKLEEATQAAVDMSAALSIDLKAAMQLIGRAATGNVELFTRYGVIIDKAAVEARGFDAVLDQLNKQFGGQAEKNAKAFTGTIEGMSNSLGDLAEVIGGLLAPVMEKLARGVDLWAQGWIALINKTQEWIGVSSKASEDGDDLAASFNKISKSGNAAADGLKKAIPIIENFLANQQISNRINNINIELRKLAVILDDQITRGAKVSKTAQKRHSDLVKEKKELILLAIANNELGSATKDTGEKTEDLGDSFKGATRVMEAYSGQAGDDLGPTINEVEESTDKLVQKLKDEEKALASVGLASFDAVEANQEVAQSINEINAAYDKAIEEQKQLAREAKASSREFSVGWSRAMDDFVSDATNGAKLAETLFNDMARNSESAMSDLFFDVVTGDFEDLSDVIDDFGKSMLRSLTDTAGTAVTGGIGSILGSLLGGGGAPGAAPAAGGGGTTILGTAGGVIGNFIAPGVGAGVGTQIGNAVQGGLKSIGKAFGFAQGGFVTGPTLGLVGEGGGPGEVIMPLDSPRTVRALAGALKEAGGGAGGGSVNIDMRGSFFPDRRSVEAFDRLLVKYNANVRNTRRATA